MSKVYIVQSSGKDLTPAKEFGELNVMLVRDEILADHEEIQTIFLTELCNITEDDYLLLIGDPINIGLAIHTAFAYIDKINVLRWDPKRYCYDAITITDITNKEIEL